MPGRARGDKMSTINPAQFHGGHNQGNTPKLSTLFFGSGESPISNVRKNDDPDHMSFALAYWILMLIWLVFGLWTHWPAANNVRPLGGTLLLFVLLVILGWKVFGPPIHS